MERNKCEGIINELIEFNFDSFIFKLTGDRKIKVIINENSIGFTGGYVWFGRDGIQTTIDYRGIRECINVKIAEFKEILVMMYI